MKRSAPMKRTAFRSKLPPQRAVKTIDYTPRPRDVAVAVQAATGPIVQVPKFVYVRDLRLRAMCRAMACQHCGAAGPDAGVTWAHSNWILHGKCKGRKASDVYVAALCHTCHMKLDQGSSWPAAVRWQVWGEAHIRTINTALKLGLWPQGIAIPSVETTTATTEETHHDRTTHRTEENQSPVLSQ